MQKQVYSFTDCLRCPHGEPRLSLTLLPLFTIYMLSSTNSVVLEMSLVRINLEGF